MHEPKKFTENDKKNLFIKSLEFKFSYAIFAISYFGAFYVSMRSKASHLANKSHKQSHEIKG